MNEYLEGKTRREPAIALGAGAGLVLGAVFDNAGAGMVLGAAFGLVFPAVFEKVRRKDNDAG